MHPHNPGIRGATVARGHGPGLMLVTAEAGQCVFLRGKANFGMDDPVVAFDGYGFGARHRQLALVALEVVNELRVLIRLKF